MARDLSSVPTEALQAEYDAGLAKIREIREAQAPLHEELCRRSNADALLRNAVINGTLAAFRTAGVPEERIQKAIEWVEAHKTEKKARRARAAAEVLS